VTCCHITDIGCTHTNHYQQQTNSVVPSSQLSVTSTTTTTSHHQIWPPVVHLPQCYKREHQQWCVRMKSIRTYNDLLVNNDHLHRVRHHQYYGRCFLLIVATFFAWTFALTDNGNAALCVVIRACCCFSRMTYVDLLLFHLNDARACCCCFTRNICCCTLNDACARCCFSRITYVVVAT